MISRCFLCWSVLLWPTLFIEIVLACTARSLTIFATGPGVCNVQSGSHEISVYELMVAPGKGYGAFATRFIHRGTPIIVEAPLVTIPLPNLTVGQGFRLADMLLDIESAYNSLEIHDQEEILSLHNFRFPEEANQDHLHDLLTIFRSNAYHTGTSHTGIFPRIARINHDCVPNSGNWWSEKRAKRIIYAMRDIRPGEEITVSYIPLLKTKNDRAARLQQYGFECKCSACQNSPETDKSRVMIGETMKELKGKAGRESKKIKVAEKRMKKAEALVNMVLAEGLLDYLPTAYHLAAVFSKQAGMADAAKKWAMLELAELGLAESGSDSGDMAAVQDFIDSLRGA